MESKLYANGKYILIQPLDPPIDSIKSSLLANPGDLNPNFLYGIVIDCGGECEHDYDDENVYVNKFNALKLNHNNTEYYIVREEDIFLTVEYGKEE